MDPILGQMGPLTALLIAQGVGAIIAGLTAPKKPKLERTNEDIFFGERVKRFRKIRDRRVLGAEIAGLIARKPSAEIIGKTQNDMGKEILSELPLYAETAPKPLEEENPFTQSDKQRKKEEEGV